MPRLNTHIAYQCNKNAADQRSGVLILKLLCICIPAIFLIGITLDWIGIYKPEPNQHAITISKVRYMDPDDVDRAYAKVEQDNFEAAAMVDKLDLQHPILFESVMKQKELTK